MVRIVASAAAAATVEEASRIVFDKKADPTAITDEVYETLAREMPCVTLAPGADVDVLAILEAKRVKGLVFEKANVDQIEIGRASCRERV